MKGTYFPEEGPIAVRVWQTTAERPFREIFTTPFSQHAYGDKEPLDVDSAVPDQPFLGIGVAMTDSSAWILSQLAPERRRELIDCVFSPNPEVGAGLSALRLNIGASDYSTALYTYDDVSGDNEMRHFSVARDDRWIFPMVKEVLSVQPETFIFAAPWSPPAWMKENGALCGGSFRDGNEKTIACYIAAYVRACRERGIKIGAVNVQNEPFYGEGIYPTCKYSMEQLSHATIELANRLQAENLPTETWFWDHNYGDADLIGTALADESLAAVVNGVAWHSYEPCAEKMGTLHRRFPELPFYHTEHGPALASPERTERWWCDRVFSAFENGCRTFTAWNLCLTTDGQPLTGPHTCGGLLSVDIDSSEISESALLRVFRHIGPFVKRGARLMHVGGDRDGAATLLFQNPDGWYVLVIGCSGRAEGRDGPPRARVHVKFHDQWLAVPLPMGMWSLTTVTFAPRG